MTLLQIAVLALIQGLTEFLPVSSSAHLILAGKFLGWPDQGLELDVAVHLGTLAAVVFYFRRELAGMVRARRGVGQGPEAELMRRLSWYVPVASLPVLVVGWLAYDLVADLLRDIRIIAAATLFFGLLLLIADRAFPEKRRLGQLHFRGALAVGLAQVLALVPGSSRSGITITMGRMLGLTAEAAARFSFLLSIPVIAVAGGHGLYRMAQADSGLYWGDFGLAVLLAAVAGWACIAAFLALLRRVGLLPFIIYRLVLGLVLAAMLL